MKTEEYNQERAKRYSKAMQEYPNARMAELTAFDIDRYISKENPTILDLGAGDGFLTRFLAERFPKAKLYAVDSSNFMLSYLDKKNNISFIHAESDKLPLEDGSIDFVVSLATFHHIDNKQETFNEVNRILSKDGVFIIADVLDNTKTQEFFDSVVREFCITGHDYPFLHKNWVDDLAKKSGLRVEKTNLKETPWKFKNRQDMALFLKDLTGLDVSTDFLLKFLFENFPIKINQSEVSLGWQLGYYVLRKQEITERKPNYVMSLEEKKQFVEIIKDMPWLYKPIINSISEHIFDSADIVDIGCADGYLLNLINLRFPKVNLVGLDIDNFLIKKASENYPFKFVKGCGKKTKVKGDLIISNLTLHHISEPEKFVKNLYRNAEKVLIISDQLRPKYKKELEKRLNKREKIVGNKDKPFYEKNEKDSILEAYSKYELIRILDSLNIEYSIQFFDNDYYERFVAVFPKKSKEVAQ